MHEKAWTLSAPCWPSAGPGLPTTGVTELMTSFCYHAKTILTIERIGLLSEIRNELDFDVVRQKLALYIKSGTGYALPTDSHRTPYKPRDRRKAATVSQDGSSTILASRLRRRATLVATSKQDWHLADQVGVVRPQPAASYQRNLKGQQRNPSKESNDVKTVEEEIELRVYRVSADILIEKQRGDAFSRCTVEALGRNGDAENTRRQGGVGTLLAEPLRLSGSQHILAAPQAFGTSTNTDNI
ncbi:hypothetical protein EVAR_25865_1 [Eumeta japonica]|uniref:Uncharacterized protein n=1 Tax=Eumeta variegata TaxID=151549 RepID=A0A4C1X7D3_EUMVA|nr:hypothetical protein EVAR_25865_1 [Eumeta japonica]